MIESFSALCLLLATIGASYAVAAAFATRRFFARPLPPAPSATPPVTILKPLCGEEPGLYEALASFCRQDYGGPVQIVFGVQHPADVALDAARRIRTDFPELDVEIVVDAARHGTNRKVSNLVNMMRRARHDLLVVADSDITVTPAYLARVVGALEAPGVGLVTCLYKGAPSRERWPRLSAMAIDHHFLPNAVFGVSTGLAKPCFGSTMALRRETLAAVGGFEAFADRLADDYDLGEAVRALGLEVAIPPFVVAHACPQGTFDEMVRHEWRVARTIRAVDAGGFAGLAATQPLPWALLALAAAGPTAPALAALGAALASRTWLQLEVDRAIGGKGRTPYVPLRDLLSAYVFVTSFFVGTVDWRGRRYDVHADGTIASQESPRA